MDNSNAKNNQKKSIRRLMTTTLIVLFSILILLSPVLFSRLKTVSSIKNIDGDLYYVDYQVDYKLDQVLDKGISNVEELEGFLSKELFFGYPIKTNENLFGCSAFAATTPDGKRIVGRNFDYAKGGALLVYTKPLNGFKSYSMVSLSHIGVSKNEGTMPETIVGKISIIAAPYACVDGLNEKGLSVSVLELQTEPTNQDGDKKDIITTLAVRMLLDKCSSTQEAIKMLGNYDMHSSAGMPYHLLISDAAGHSVVVDWAENRMNVIDQSYATNFQLSTGQDYGVGIGHDRYNKIKEKMESTDSVISETGAMKLLEDVSVKWNGEWATEWSVVYNISDFAVEICNDMNYKKSYKFSE